MPSQKTVSASRPDEKHQAAINQIALLLWRRGCSGAALPEQTADDNSCMQAPSVGVATISCFTVYCLCFTYTATACRVRTVL
jgi:hypothetical protein